MVEPASISSRVEGAILDPRAVDPKQELVDYSAMDDAEISQIVRVLQSIRRWREAEQKMSLSSRNHMKLNENDMKALRFLVVCKNEGLIATPGGLAEHLSISSASTTKLLDRLAAAGHIERSAHPSDRRALMITITQQTHEQVRDTVGRTHARRFDVAAKLSPEDREVVIRFLNDLSNTSDEAQELQGEAAVRPQNAD
ncbi:MarR family winged helix-turn-helix transcriptional regulator [Parafrigoribacterium humi]|uniref:MarR family winged helix-turn-helix transcriptional regulator n=1 Tax=Parafrigoribacterium humi TaxID=3144664 RepID=UPI0032ECEBB4